MDKETVKGQLVRDKEFLRQLYETRDQPKVKHLLTFASDGQLNTLIKFLHFLSTGEITIRKENFDHISRARKIQVLKKFVETKAGVQRMLKADRKIKISFLKKLSTVYPFLLHCLFNE